MSRGARERGALRVLGKGVLPNDKVGTWPWGLQPIGLESIGRSRGQHVFGAAGLIYVRTLVLFIPGLSSVLPHFAIPTDGIFGHLHYQKSIIWGGPLNIINLGPAISKCGAGPGIMAPGGQCIFPLTPLPGQVQMASLGPT